MAYVLDNDYNLGEIVYLKTDPSQFGRMVTGIKLCIDESILYELTVGEMVTHHYQAEISKEKSTININEV